MSELRALGKAKYCAPCANRPSRQAKPGCGSKTHPALSSYFWPFPRVGHGVGLAAGRRNKRFFNGATLLVKICAAKQRKVLHPMKRFSYRYKSMASFFLCHSVEVTLSMPYTRWGVKYKSRRGKINKRFGEFSLKMCYTYLKISR